MQRAQLLMYLEPLLALQHKHLCLKIANNLKKKHGNI